MRLKARPDPDFWQISRVALAALILTVLVLGRLALAGGDLPYGQGLLWKVERDGVAPSYLFGTIHITDERVLDLPPEVEAAFNSARSATFEVIMTDELRLRLAQAMVLNDGRTLETILDRLPRFRLAKQEPIERHRSFLIRGPAALPLRFDA